MRPIGQQRLQVPHHFRDERIFRMTPDGFGVLLRYAEMMERYAEVMDSLDDIDEEELSTADEIYYLEVLSRINRKLLESSAED